MGRRRTRPAGGPCNHTAANTPPCTEALVRGRRGCGDHRGSKTRDPTSGPGGGAAARRRRSRSPSASVPTRLRILPYLHQRRTGRGFAAEDGDEPRRSHRRGATRQSQWITGEEARADAHRWRAESQAIVVGPGTATGRPARLTVRQDGQSAERQPLRVLLDAHGRVPADGPLFDLTLAPTLVVTTDVSSGIRAGGLAGAAGAKVEVLGPGRTGGAWISTVSSRSWPSATACSRR